MDFAESVEDEEPEVELSRDEILRLNKIKNLYSRKQIESFDGTYDEREICSQQQYSSH